MIERRRHHRAKSLLGARLRVGRQSTMYCIVRNISPEGAMIEFPRTALAPAEFRLHIVQRAEVFAARVIWRRNERAGVALSGMQKLAVPVDAVGR